MDGNISIEYPEFLANSLRMKGRDFENEMKITSLVKLYELGKLSSGTAAKVLGISRIDFLDLLAKYKVSSIGACDINKINEDISNA